MKKLVLIIAAAVMCSAAGAQIAPFKLNEKLLLGAIERSNEAIANPKRAQRGQTWLDRGDAMYKAAGYMLTQTFPGQTEKEMVAALGKMDPTDVEPNGIVFQMYSYPYADVYVRNGIVQFWVMKTIVYEGAEDKAVEAYKKAAELDPRLSEKAKTGITNVGDLVSIAANAQSNLGNLESAAELYWKGFNIKKDPLIGKIDSISVFNSGYIFMANGKYDRAIEILDAAIANNVWENGKTPYYLAYALIQTEKYDRAKEVLSEGLKRFPGDKNLIETMIGYYGLTGGDFNEIKAMLEEALQNNPENASIWNGLAQIYKSSEDTEKSIEFFTRYVAQFPESVQSNYYLGDILYEKANRIVDSIKDDKTMSKASRDTANEQAKDIYRQAWKYLKVAYEGETSPQMAIIQRYLHTTFMLIDDPGMQEVYDKVEPIFQAMLDAQQN